MIKNFLKNILLGISQAPSVPPSNPEFVSTHNSHTKSDFEVSELSYDEYVEYAGPERRMAMSQVDEDRRRPY